MNRSLRIIALICALFLVWAVFTEGYILYREEGGELMSNYVEWGSVPYFIMPPERITNSEAEGLNYTTPHIYGNYVSYVDDYNDIHMYNILTEVNSIVAQNDTVNYNNPTVWQNYITYDAFDLFDTYLYNITSNASKMVDAIQADQWRHSHMYEGRVCARNGDRDIRLYNIATNTSSIVYTTPNTFTNVQYPKLSDDYILFMEWRRGATSFDRLVLYDIIGSGSSVIVSVGGTTTQLQDWMIHGEHVLYSTLSGGVTRVYLYNISDASTIDLSAASPYSSNTREDSSVYNNLAIWNAMYNGSWHMELYDSISDEFLMLTHENATSGRMPRLYMDAEGNATLVYHRTEDGYTDIWKIDIRTSLPVYDTNPPEIVHEQTALWWNTTVPIPITANVSDNVSVDTVLLFYKNVNDTEYWSTSMSLVSGNMSVGNWSAYIPTQSESGFVYYYIWANDTSDNFNTSATYMVNIDGDAPIITHTPITEAEIYEEIYIVANITDNQGIVVVQISYKGVGELTFVNITALQLSGNTTEGRWGATIPAQSEDGNLEYYISATDLSDNYGQTDTFTVSILDEDENGNDDEDDNGNGGIIIEGKIIYNIPTITLMGVATAMLIGIGLYLYIVPPENRRDWDDYFW